MNLSHIAGMKSTLQAFEELADKQGKQWKAQSMTYSGREAMKPVVSRAKSIAPTGPTKVLARKLTLKGSFRANRRKGSELDVYTTYGKSFESAFAKARPKDKVVRYPYIIEAGLRKNRSFKRKDGTIVRFKKGIKANPFQKKAMYQLRVQTVYKFKQGLDRSLSLMADNVGKRSVRQATKELRLMQQSAFYGGRNVQ